MPGFLRDLLSHCLEAAFTSNANEVGHFERTDQALAWFAELEPVSGLAPALG
jgi:hypothetical protein